MRWEGMDDAVGGMALGKGDWTGDGEVRCVVGGRGMMGMFVEVGLWMGCWNVMASLADFLTARDGGWDFLRRWILVRQWSPVSLVPGSVNFWGGFHYGFVDWDSRFSISRAQELEGKEC